MRDGAWPPVVEVLPHRPPMALLSRIVSHDPTRTVCAIDVTPSTAFLTAEKVVPAWVGIEYMAQCVAAHAGLRARAHGEPVKLGLLIGARRIDLHVEAFTVQQTLVVRGVHVWGEHELASFECAVLDGDADRVLAEGTLSVYSPRDAATLWAER